MSEARLPFIEPGTLIGENPCISVCQIIPPSSEYYFREERMLKIFPSCELSVPHGSTLPGDLKVVPNPDAE